MRINTKFPMAIHILAVAALNVDDTMPSTSELIAKSVGTNPVVVRRLSSQLKTAGLICARAGVAGLSLAKDAEEISLLDIYKAVREEDEVIFDVHQNPSEKCWVGHNIQGALETPFAEAQRALENALESYRLSDITIEIQRRSGRE